LSRSSGPLTHTPHHTALRDLPSPTPTGALFQERPRPPPRFQHTTYYLWRSRRARGANLSGSRVRAAAVLTAMVQGPGAAPPTPARWSAPLSAYLRRWHRPHGCLDPPRNQHTESHTPGARPAMRSTFDRTRQQLRVGQRRRVGPWPHTQRGAAHAGPEPEQRPRPPGGNPWSARSTPNNTTPVGQHPRGLRGPAHPTPRQRFDDRLFRDRAQHLDTRRP